MRRNFVFILLIFSLTFKLFGSEFSFNADLKCKSEDNRFDISSNLARFSLTSDEKLRIGKNLATAGVICVSVSGVTLVSGIVLLACGGYSIYLQDTEYNKIKDEYISGEITYEEKRDRVIANSNYWWPIYTGLFIGGALSLLVFFATAGAGIPLTAVGFSLIKRYSKKAVRESIVLDYRVDRFNLYYKIMLWEQVKYKINYKKNKTKD